jgi:hypothetical protein
MADEFDLFLTADDRGAVGNTIDAVFGAADSVGDWLFGEDDDDTVFGIGADDGSMAQYEGFGGLAGAAANPAAQQAAMSIVSAIMGSDVVAALARNMLDRLPGVIFDAREPAFQGSPLTGAMLAILFRKCTKNEQEAIVERLAGGMSPMSDNTKTRSVFRVLYVYDALRSLNEQDAAEAIFNGLK